MEREGRKEGRKKGRKEGYVVIRLKISWIGKFVKVREGRGRRETAETNKERERVEEEEHVVAIDNSSEHVHT